MFVDAYRCFKVSELWPHMRIPRDYQDEFLHLTDHDEGLQRLSLGFLGSLGTELGPRVRSFQHGIKKEDYAPTCMDYILHIGHWPGLSEAMCKSGCLLAKVVLYEGS